MAEEICLPVERVRAVLRMAQQPISLQAQVGDSDDTTFGDFIEDKSAENPSEMTAYALLKEKIRDVLDTLTERERAVLEQAPALDLARVRAGAGGESALGGAALGGLLLATLSTGGIGGAASGA